MTGLLLALVLFVGQVGTVQISGDANFAAASHGSSYLAMRLPHGTIVTLCGAGGCRTLAVSDYGPVPSTGDIADIALVVFAHVCGYTIAEAKRRGECVVTVELLGDVPLPPTDTEMWAQPWGWSR